MWTFEMPKLVSSPHQTYQTSIIACSSITWIIGAVFVALRFYTRGVLLNNVLGAEDWLMLLSLVFSGATCAGMIEQAVYGLGKHMLDIEPTLLMPLARAGWYTILWYLLSLLCTKISILLLYIRILSYQYARWVVYIIMAIVIFTNGIWPLATVVTACTPLASFWDRSIPQESCREAPYWYANTALHIITDFLLYVVPLPVILGLKVRLRQKLALYAVFALGFLVCSISVVRLWDLYEEPKRQDFTYDNVSISYLTTVELNAAIACACCMTLKPLVARLFPRLFRSRSSIGAQRGRDIEAAGVGGKEAQKSPGGRTDTRRPPTIGSGPSRTVGTAGARGRRPSWALLGILHGRQGGSQLLDDDEDEQCFAVEERRKGSEDSGSGESSSGMPRLPEVVHDPGKGARGAVKEVEMETGVFAKGTDVKWKREEQTYSE